MDNGKNKSKRNKSHNIPQQVQYNRPHTQLFPIRPKSFDFLKKYQIIMIFSFLKALYTKSLRKEKKINQQKKIQHK